MTEIQARVEGKRGCGYRKAGGLYLVAKFEGVACCKLPFPLEVCPACGAGIRPSRAWTWVDADKLFWPDWEEGDPSLCQRLPHADEWRQGIRQTCPLAFHGGIGRAGLIWIGEQFYPTVGHFQEEAARMGISRRVNALPKGFVLGETWVLLAHRKGVQTTVEVQEGLFAEAGMRLTETGWKPAIFTVFRPQAVEYVVRGDETPEQLERLERRGITPVQVSHRRAQQ